MAPKNHASPRASRPTDQALRPSTAFFVFLAANFLAATYSPILDCDEIYNYWEPTHYLNHGYGMQTWEYSPEYAIRSWLYATLHAIPIAFTTWLPFLSSKTVEFYFLRYILAYACATCEARFYAAVSYAMNPRIGLYLLICLVSSAGMFHASVAYLPSSFAMYCIMLAIPAFLDRRAGSKTARGLTWLALGSIVGWPFVAVFSIPFVAEQLALCVITGEGLSMFFRLFDGLFRSLAILALEIAFDSIFYKKLTCVPFNIVWYNVLSRTGKGPNIYGTEPSHWYFRNLLINFNIWFVLALGCLPLVLFQCLYRNKVASRLNFFPTMIFTSLFYLWLVIFTIQPHKEERFMYPLYPCLALNAAVSIHVLLSIIGTRTAKGSLSLIPDRLKSLAITSTAMLAIFLGLSRIAALATAYSAPFSIYSALNQQASLSATNSTATINVCVGKEWYRFPSSYFLPANGRLKFIKSEFAGLLPGEFLENNGSYYEIPRGTWTIPSGMNDENKEDFEKYTKDEDCDFLIDTWFPGTSPAPLEPDFVLDESKWKQVLCKPFLHAERTSIIGRLFWLPDSDLVPERLRRVWGQYCLLKRRTGRGSH